MKKLLIVLIFGFISLQAFSFEVINSTVKNGQTALIKFKAENSIKYKHIRIDKKRYKIFNNTVLIPISYYAKEKTLKVIVNYRENNSKMKFEIIFIQVVDGKYQKEEIKVDKSRVNPNKKNAARAAKEYAEAMRIYNSVTTQSFIDSEFLMPLDSKITSAFGKARTYNGSLKGYHSGTDFRAKVGTPLKASNTGVVVLAKNRFYSGGSIIIDHGQGIYTCYYHMSKFNVKKGQKITKGDIIGLSGVSGRVTGPHLHFSARVSGIQVDPLQLIRLLNENILRK